MYCAVLISSPKALKLMEEYILKMTTIVSDRKLWTNETRFKYTYIFFNACKGHIISKCPFVVLKSTKKTKKKFCKDFSKKRPNQKSSVIERGPMSTNRK